MDYKNLLIKYLAHVHKVNGDDYILLVNVSSNMTEDIDPKTKKKVPIFSHEEAAELERIEASALDLFPGIQ
jgi:hypothetical protein